jgi:predicted small secreted protein
MPAHSAASKPKGGNQARSVHREYAMKTNLRLGLLAALALLSACNTIQGAGRDIKSVGSAIDRAAADNKD